MDFREYINGDENDILNVFERSFGRRLSNDYWKWRYIDNPNKNEKLINLAWEESRLTAHYAVSPIQLFINGNIYDAALSMTTMTDPDYRGMGLFTKLAKDLYTKNGKVIDVIFGVPNENSVNGFIQKLGFGLIKEIPMLESKITNKRYEISDKCVIINKFDEKFDELLLLIIKKYNIITSRDSEYLNWRFVDNPENKYQILAYIVEGKVLGYTVVKTYNRNSTLIGDIVDLIATNEMVLRQLLGFAFSIFQSKNVTNVNTWFSDNILIKVLREFNFEANGSYFHFIVRDNSEIAKEGLMDFNNWYLTMSDIDLF